MQKWQFKSLVSNNLKSSSYSTHIGKINFQKCFQESMFMLLDKKSRENLVANISFG